MNPAHADSSTQGVHASQWISELTIVAQNYLKVIWNAQEWSTTKVTTSMLAEKLGVSPSTASEALRKLVDQGLVVHERYGTVSLSPKGRAGAVLMVRRHRLIETFLVRELDYSWDEVHDEAEVLEHAVSEVLIHRLDMKLGRPIHDPHGDPIPDCNGTVPTRIARRLSEVVSGSSGRVARISDDDSAMLRYLDSIGIALDCRIRVLERRPFVGTVSIEVDGGCVVDLGDLATKAIWLSPESETWSIGD